MAGKRRAGIGNASRAERPIKVREAAKLRARGATWQGVADALGYSSGNTAQVHLAQDHKEQWIAAYEEELRNYISEEAEPKALQAQGNLIEMLLEPSQIGKLKPHQIKACQAAAHSVLAHSAKLRAQLIQIDQRQFIEKVQADQELIEEIRKSGELAVQAVGTGPGLPVADAEDLLPGEEDEEVSEDIHGLLVSGGD